MEKDEKICPKCGETIKLIAIKCKHCHSILCDPNDEDAYYYRYGSGKQMGPFTYEEIKHLYTNEKISSSVFISKNKSNDWDVITNYLIHNGDESIKKLNEEVSSNKNWIFLIFGIVVCSFLLKFIFFSAAEIDIKKIIDGSPIMIQK